MEQVLPAPVTPPVRPMAKRAAKSKPATESPSPRTERGVFEKLGERIDAIPEVQAAEAAVRTAREELEKAQALCQKVREQASATIDDAREQSLGDWVDASLEAVRKHPAAGVSLAFAAGMFLGRLLRK
ncbi:MAG: hypothetical protein KDA42_16070 [Planctomycetales bacterium]|nr:hypothetical protein [Planctomycetales bacterium]